MFEKIIAAVNSDPGRADQVADMAAELARVFEADVLVVHVREIKRPAALVGAVAGAASTLHMESEEEAGTFVAGIVDRLRSSGLRAQGRVHERFYGGSTAKELADIASSFRASLIVVGECRSRVADAFLGGITHRLVQAAPCAVLTVR
jgi:nucleotide-binding universal stress UspA family protein